MADMMKIIGGPVTIFVSSTTIGNTEDGVVARSTAEFNRITTHESGPVPVMVSQRGSRWWRVEVAECEVSKASLQRMFQDATFTETSTGFVATWAPSKANKILTSKTVKFVQKNAAGKTFTFTLNKAVPVAETPELVGKNADGSKWIFRMGWEGVWDSTTLAKISGQT